MNAAQDRKLADQIEQHYPEYRGWDFETDFHTGAFYYTKPVGDGWLDVFFTPEFYEVGVQAVSVANENGEVQDEFTQDIPFDNSIFNVHSIALVAHQVIDRIESAQ